MTRCYQANLKAVGFTFVEVVLSLALVATALISLAALIPAGQKAARDARQRTVIGQVLETVHERIEGQPLKDGPVAAGPYFFDEEGGVIEADAPPERLARRHLRADVRLAPPAYPETTAQHAPGLKAAIIEIAWPVDPASGEIVSQPGRDTRAQLTYFVNALTSPGWKQADPSFEPTIGN